MSTPATPLLIDTIDSFYQFVKNNVLQINPQREFGGIVDARDWPPKNIVDQGIYLAHTLDAPVRTKQSFYDPLIAFTLDWRWAIKGENIPQNAQAANRGDKYRLNIQIIQELLSAHNPGYAPKNQYSITNDANNDPVLVATPYDPPDSLWWDIPAFTPKIDRMSGMIYTTGRVTVSSYGPISANLGS